MAIIRCISGDDGSLTPLAVEFEPGDLVEFTSGEPGDAMEVRRAFTLDDLSEHKEQLMIRLDVAGDSASSFRIRPDPKLPPPPPVDGDFILKPAAGASANPIKVVIGKSAKGAVRTASS